jgi:glycosyltransferase involved in cell wall biosynthesis
VNSKISVIIPTHNRASSARRAISSVLAQTYQNFEIIVVDDCSSDKHSIPDIVKTLNDDRVISVRHNESLGPSAARNTGINSSKGDYIAFLDDDDIWMETKLKDQLHSLGACIASMSGFFTQAGVRVKSKKTTLNVKDIIYERDYAINSGLLVKSSYIKDVRYDNDLRVGEDIDFLFKILRKGEVKYINKPLYFVNLGDHSRITNENIDDLVAIERRLEFIKRNYQIYGKFWANYNIASIVLRGLKFNKIHLSKLKSVYSRCGFLSTNYALYRKLIKKL